MINIKSTFRDFSKKKVIVVGDVMIDTYIHGGVERISPEAPVPVVRYSKTEERLGGAANVGLNIKALEATPIICSVLGKDREANVFKKLLEDNGLSQDGLLFDSERCTTNKTRVIGNNQQLIRVDKEDTHELSSSMEDQLIEKVKSLSISENVDAIIFEDYNKGVLTEKVISELIAFANEKNIITTVDPKKENFFVYENVTLFKPNLKELKEGTNSNFDTNDREAFLNAAKTLHERLKPRLLFVTLSAAGVYINNEEGKDVFIPAHYRNIADVSGAGDTVISAITLCLTCGLDAKLSAEIANLAGGLVCEKVGVVSVDKEQLMNEALAL